MDNVRSGDSVTALSIDRLARNAKDLLTIVAELEGKGASLYSVTEAIDTSTAMGKMILTILGAVSIPYVIWQDVRRYPTLK